MVVQNMVLMYCKPISDMLPEIKQKKKEKKNKYLFFPISYIRAFNFVISEITI